MTWFSSLFLIIFFKSAPVGQVRTFHVAIFYWLLSVMSSLVAPPHWSITNLFFFLFFFLGNSHFFRTFAAAAHTRVFFFPSIL